MSGSAVRFCPKSKRTRLQLVSSPSVFKPELKFVPAISGSSNPHLSCGSGVKLLLSDILVYMYFSLAGD